MNYTYIGLGLLGIYLVMQQSHKVLLSTERAFGDLNAAQENAVKLITAAFKRYGDGDKRKLAYILATAWHESKFLPVRELRAKWGTALYELQNRYWNTGYYGRGYVQLTWEENYRKFSQILGVDLVKNPDLALNPKYAADILVIGMMKGLFTGRKLSDYINKQGYDYVNARRVVNALDRAQLISDYTNDLKDEGIAGVVDPKIICETCEMLLI